MKHPKGHINNLCKTAVAASQPYSCGLKQTQPMAKQLVCGLKSSRRHGSSLCPNMVVEPFCITGLSQIELSRPINPQFLVLFEYLLIAVFSRHMTTSSLRAETHEPVTFRPASHVGVQFLGQHGKSLGPRLSPFKPLRL